MDSGSAIPSTSRDDFYALPLNLPPLQEQRSIAHILGTLDDKIELNRRMNETLEAMARAIFKSWFVDFDPVRAKAEGRQPFGMNAETAALFPASFEDSPLGKIPKSWNVGSVYEIAEVRYGAPFASGLFNSDRRGKPLIRIRDLSTQEPEVYTTEDHPRAEEIAAGDIVVGMDGEFRAYLWRGPTAVLNQRLCTFTPKGGVPKIFIAEAIREHLEFFERSKTGTTVIHLGKGDIDTFRILLPPPRVLGAFGNAAGALVNRSVQNSAENRTLAEVRDALLPKLISGEIRLSRERMI